MIRSKRSLRKGKNAPLAQVGKDIENHLSWRGELSLMEAAALLEGSSPFTYVLTQGMDKHHYFLTYVDANRKVKHRNVRSALKNGVVMYWNGGGNGGGYETIDNLVPGCLNCSESVCRPL